MKHIALVMLMLVLLVLSISAQASTPTMSGSETLRYRNDKNDINPEKTGSGFIDTIVLGYNVPIDKHFSIYVRMGIQILSKTDFGRNFADYQRNRKFVAQLDQFCLVYSNAGYTYKLGRQSTSIGVTGLLYDNTKSIGRHRFVDGISMEAKKGDITIKAIAAQEDNEGAVDNRLYGVTYLYQNTPRLTAGGTLARYDFADATSDTSYYALYSSYEVNKLFLYAEHSQAPSKINMTGHNLGASYQIDPSNQIYVITHKTEPNADMNGKTAFEHDEKGYYYGFVHRLNAVNQMDLLYKNNKQYYTDISHLSLQVTFNHLF